MQISFLIIYFKYFVIFVVLKTSLKDKLWKIKLFDFFLFQLNGLVTYTLKSQGNSCWFQESGIVYLIKINMLINSLFRNSNAVLD